MHTVGLITEYNPFHNGHLHHLRSSFRESGAEAAVAVMSGHFLQRGEPALCCKWTRARMALAAGVDVVLELPLPWACNSAPHFADGALRSLAALGVGAFCFGSESGDITALQAGAEALQAHAGELEVQTRQRMRQGLAWPLARAEAAAELGMAGLVPLLREPNNILGLEYLRAAGEWAPAIKALTVPRIGAGYHELQAIGDIASATGIRERLRDDRPVADYLPGESAQLLQEAQRAGLSADEDLLLRLQLLALQRQRLEDVYQMAGGIAARLQQAAAVADTREGLVTAGKSKQLTRTRLQRLLIYTLIGLEASIMQRQLECGPLYLHVLGMSAQGENVMRSWRNRATLPLVTNYSRVRSQLRRHYGANPLLLQLASQQLEIELAATRIYTLLLPGWQGGNRNRDFYEPCLRSC